MGRPSVYSCMTNGGIIEGNTEYSGFSDLSPATYFGSGETRMQMRSWQRFGGINASTPPRSHNFMKYLAIILTIVPSLVLAQGDNYSVSYTDPSTGDIRFLNATVTHNLTKDQELALCHEKIMALFDSQRQRRFQQEQLRLLRQIANQ